MITSHKVSTIRYTKDTGETTARTIIPTFVPHQNIKAVDVTDLSADDTERMEVLVREYYEDYLEARKATTFTLEDWLHATGELDMSSKVKYRTFKMKNVEEI
jgi:hypothetical protein